jgi:hypothetical protein
MTRLQQPDCPHTPDAAAFLLGAHDDPDGFRDHASGCTSCRDELARLRPVADALATATPEMRAPRALRRRVLESVDAEAELLRAAGGEADRPERARTTRRGLVPALAAAALLAAAAIAVALAGSSGTPARTTFATRAPAVATATAALRQASGHAELLVTHMPQAPSGRIYEVWLERDGSPPQPTDVLFNVTREGSGSVAVPADLRHVSKVLVTSEPAGGSRHPTRPPLLTFKLAT